jgi:hypothetical protein
MPAMRRVPRADAGIAGALSQRFRAEEIHSYSFENGIWSTWATEADWDATERSGVIRDPEAAAAGHGPVDWQRADLVGWLGLDVPAPRRLTKAALVAALRAVDGLPAAAVAVLDAA